MRRRVRHLRRESRRVRELRAELCVPNCTRTVVLVIPICSSGRYVSGAGEWTPWPSVFACSREMYRLPLLRDVSEYDGASPMVAVPKRSAAGM